MTEINELCEAVKESKVLTARHLIANNAKCVLSKDLDNRTALHWAVSLSNSELVAMLLNPGNGVEVDIDELEDDAGWTPFHIAAAIGDLAILDLLLKHDPKPTVDQQTNNGSTAVHLATSKNHLEVVSLLIGEPNKASVRIKDKKQQLPIHRAASIGSIALINVLGPKSPINARDSSGWTPLHHSLAEGFGDAAVLLVKLGADPEIRNSDNERPIDVAVDDKIAKYFASEVAKLST